MGSAKVSYRRWHRRAKRLIVVLAFAVVAGTVPATQAQEPGVVYEPGSPSDKEYAIPLEEARRDAGGERPDKFEALPFGIGLSRRGGRGPGARSRDGGGRGSQSARGGRAQAGRGRVTGLRDFRQRLADAEEAGAPSLWKLGPLLLVLLPALLIGLLLARRDRQEPATT